MSPSGDSWTCLDPGASAALECLVLLQLNETVRLGWARRYQDRVANETGQRFGLSPAAAAGEAGDTSYLRWLRVILEDRRPDEPLEDAALRTLDRMAAAH